VPRNADVLFFGRLEAYKGIGVLVEAMEEVWRVYPSVRLTVAGRGPAATEVPDGDPRIRRIAGYVSDEDRDRLFAEATLLVAPYLEASQSGVVSLAVGRGIPTVVSDAGALPDLAVDPSLVVPVGDARALANAVMTTLEHGEPLRRRVYDMAIERLSWSVVGGLTLAFYRRLLAS
jgi:glycosyltransferase involved in cell wall biosynthesis